MRPWKDHDEVYFTMQIGRCHCVLVKIDLFSLETNIYDFVIIMVSDNIIDETFNNLAKILLNILFSSGQFKPSARRIQTSWC